MYAAELTKNPEASELKAQAEGKVPILAAKHSPLIGAIAYLLLLLKLKIRLLHILNFG